MSSTKTGLLTLLTYLLLLAAPALVFPRFINSEKVIYILVACVIVGFAAFTFFSKKKISLVASIVIALLLAGGEIIAFNIYSGFATLEDLEGIGIVVVILAAMVVNKYSGLAIEEGEGGRLFFSSIIPLGFLLTNKLLTIGCALIVWAGLAFGWSAYKGRINEINESESEIEKLKQQVSQGEAVLREIEKYTQIKSELELKFEETAAIIPTTEAFGAWLKKATEEAQGGKLNHVESGLLKAKRGGGGVYTEQKYFISARGKLENFLSLLVEVANAPGMSVPYFINLAGPDEDNVVGRIEWEAIAFHKNIPSENRKKDVEWKPPKIRELPAGNMPSWHKDFRDVQANEIKKQLAQVEQGRKLLLEILELNRTLDMNLEIVEDIKKGGRNGLSPEMTLALLTEIRRITEESRKNGWRFKLLSLDTLSVVSMRFAVPPGMNMKPDKVVVEIPPPEAAPQEEPAKKKRNEPVIITKVEITIYKSPAFVAPSEAGNRNVPMARNRSPIVQVNEHKWNIKGATRLKVKGTRLPGPPHGDVHDILKLENGKYYIATDRGIVVASPSGGGYSFEGYNVFNGLLANLVFDLELDGKGRIWAATQGGVSILDGDTLINISRGFGFVDSGVVTLTWEGSAMRAKTEEQGELVFSGDTATYLSPEMLDPQESPEAKEKRYYSYTNREPTTLEEKDLTPNLEDLRKILGQGDISLYPGLFSGPKEQTVAAEKKDPLEGLRPEYVGPQKFDASGRIVKLEKPEHEETMKDRLGKLILMLGIAAAIVCAFLVYLKLSNARLRPASARRG